MFIQHHRADGRRHHRAGALQQSQGTHGDFFQRKILQPDAANGTHRRQVEDGQPDPGSGHADLDAAVKEQRAQNGCQGGCHRLGGSQGNGIHPAQGAAAENQGKGRDRGRKEGANLSQPQRKLAGTAQQVHTHHHHHLHGDVLAVVRRAEKQQAKNGGDDRGEGAQESHIGDGTRVQRHIAQKIGAGSTQAGGQNIPQGALPQAPDDPSARDEQHDDHAQAVAHGQQRIDRHGPVGRFGDGVTDGIENALQQDQKAGQHAHPAEGWTLCFLLLHANTSFQHTISRVPHISPAVNKKPPGSKGKAAVPGTAAAGNQISGQGGVPRCRGTPYSRPHRRSCRW